MNQSYKAGKYVKKSATATVNTQDKSFTQDFRIKSAEQKEINGVPVGVVKGLASTFNNIDRHGDKIMPGAFSATIKEFQESGRQVRMLFNHDHMEIIGGFPPDLMKETSEGLEVEGHINLQTEKGREIHALAKQGVITDFSIGFSSDNFEIDGDDLIFKEIMLWEISIVNEPANPKAVIHEVKSNHQKASEPSLDLPIAPRETVWDSRKAIERVRELTRSEEEPAGDFRRAFMFFDESAPENFGSYKLPFADVIDGKLTAVPRALIAIQSVLAGARGGVDIPEEDLPVIIENVNSYLEKIDIEEIELALDEFLNDDAEDQKQKISVTDIKSCATRKDLEKLLRKSGSFSRDASTVLAGAYIKDLEQGKPGNGSDVKDENQGKPDQSLIKDIELIKDQLSVFEKDNDLNSQINSIKNNLFGDS